MVSDLLDKYTHEPVSTAADSYFMRWQIDRLKFICAMFAIFLLNNPMAHAQTSKHLNVVNLVLGGGGPHPHLGVDYAFFYSDCVGDAGCVRPGAFIGLVNLKARELNAGLSLLTYATVLGFDAGARFNPEGMAAYYLNANFGWIIRLYLTAGYYQKKQTPFAEVGITLWGGK